MSADIYIEIIKRLFTYENGDIISCEMFFDGLNSNDDWDEVFKFNCIITHFEELGFIKEMYIPYCSECESELQDPVDNINDVFKVKTCKYCGNKVDPMEANVVYKKII
jgi:hypothetical protein